jgi:DNA mismatch repair protein MutS2
MESLEVLEFSKIIDTVKDYCISDFSKARLERTRPSGSKKVIEEIFQELREMVFAIDNDVNPQLSNLYDTSDILHKSSIKNNYLSPPEISMVRENIISFQWLKRRLSPLFSDTPLLSKKLKNVNPMSELLGKINRVIDDHGNLRDDSSPRLSETIQKIREIRQSIEKTLESYFHSPETKNFIQEKHITLKEDRYVIPLKHNFKGKIPGIVHAQSGSGETLFLEPFSVTSRNNELKILEKEKEKEIERLLTALTAEVGKNRRLLSHIQDILSDVDILLSKYRFMEEYGCTLPELTDRREVLLTEAKHPLIGEGVVPVDFHVADSSVGVVITGPNTGGKTVLLKTVGLFVLLAQSGFPVPAARMKTFVFDSIYADIGDEQSIEQSLSTFSAHIRNIKTIVEKADSSCLVLIDELGAGTDPVEGGAIGTAILDHLVKNNVLSIVTTHFSIIKMYALENDRVQVASVQFDSVTCKPSYKLLMGIPGRSNAIEIARHLGLRQEIIDNTSRYLNEKERAMNDVLKNLGEMEQRLREKSEEIGRNQSRLKYLISSYEQKVKEVREKEKALHSQYKTELTGMLSEYRRRLEEEIQAVRKSDAEKESIKSAKNEIQTVEQDFLQHINSTRTENVETAEYVPVVGDKVFVNSEYGEDIEGKILDIRDDMITVQAGIMKVTVERDSVEPIPKKHGKRENRGEAGWEFVPSNQDEGVYECDIRGKRYEEAMREVVQFLDNAVLRNAETVTIIHGLGTGALRQGVWENLNNYKYVDHFSYALPEQGGFGCTIVKLKK